MREDGTPVSLAPVRSRVQGAEPGGAEGDPDGYVVSARGGEACVPSFEGEHEVRVGEGQFEDQGSG